jgi:4-methyl-5(b-hydroxyethyl)-thiazole monophosphate biosynthesis
MIAILLADGFEEIEALTPLDVLRRAGLDVKTVAITSKIAIGSHGIPVVCDLCADEVNYDEVSAVIFPGGMPGSLNLDASPVSDKMIDSVNKKGGIIAAICAAPLVLGHRGLLEGKRATCYPGFEKELTGAAVVSGGCVIDTSEKGTVVTAAGMGVAYDFGMKLVELLRGKACADHIHAAVMAPGARA